MCKSVVDPDWFHLPPPTVSVTDISRESARQLLNSDEPGNRELAQHYLIINSETLKEALEWFVVAIRDPDPSVRRVSLQGFSFFIQPVRRWFGAFQPPVLWWNDSFDDQMQADLLQEFVKHKLDENASLLLLYRGVLGDTSVVKLVLEHYSEDLHRMDRRFLILALKELGGPLAAEGLRSILQRPDATNTEFIVIELASLGYVERAELESLPDWARNDIRHLLAMSKCGYTEFNNELIDTLNRTPFIEWGSSAFQYYFDDLKHLSYDQESILPVLAELLSTQQQG